MLDVGQQGDHELMGRLFDPASAADPYAVYREANVVGCRHALATTMLRDPRFGPPVLGLEQADEEMWRTFSRWMLNLDGDRHAAMRRRFSRIFTPTRVEQYRPTIEQRADELIDAVIDAGTMDFVSGYARPLPFSIITTVLGVPDDRSDWLRDRMLALDTGFARQQDPSAVRAASGAVAEMLELFGALLDERSRAPRDDLLSQLATDLPPDDEGRADLLANCIFFVEAGHVTTSSLLTGGLVLLLENPGQLDALRADPAKIRPAVEEMLRLISPVSVVLCRAREAVEIDGVAFAAGEQRTVFPAGANRDPAVYPEPDAFDIDRPTVPHLAFSGGAHFCLGAPLARLHGEVGLERVLARLTDIGLAGPPEWLGSIPLREPSRLPIRWTVPVPSERAADA